MILGHLYLNKNPIQVNDIFADNKMHNNIVEKFEGKSRAYLEIQQGCDHQVYILYNTIWQRK